MLPETVIKPLLQLSDTLSGGLKHLSLQTDMDPATFTALMQTCITAGSTKLIWGSIKGQVVNQSHDQPFFTTLAAQVTWDQSLYEPASQPHHFPSMPASKMRHTRQRIKWCNLLLGGMLYTIHHLHLAPSCSLRTTAENSKTAGKRAKDFSLNNSHTTEKSNKGQDQIKTMKLS